jgi:hypothetical protein
METKFKILETEEYTLAVSDEKIELESVLLTPYNEVYKVIGFNGGIPIDVNGNGNLLNNRKIIAYQPKGNAPELDLPLLPDVEDDVEKLAEEYVIDESYLPVYKEECKRTYINGYKAATKVYSEDDLEKAIQYSYGLGVLGLKLNKDEIIQSLKHPKWFVAEIEYQNLNGKWGSYYPFASSAKDSRLKTTTINNKTYLVGTYLN